MTANRLHRGTTSSNRWKGKLRGHIGVTICSVAGALLAVPAVAQYHTHGEIGQELLAAETNYPSICKRYDLGLSYQGRSLWALRISDNVPLEEDEPEVKYVSTMHGNEPMGMELCLNLIEYLTTNYGTDSRVTNIVDEVDLWIVPLMNPDGYVAGTRENAQGYDLNRNFPDPFSSPSNTIDGRGRETQRIMTWTFGESFTLAVNYHGGALVANYPFDGNPTGSSVYTASPDDDLFIWISEEYTRHNQPMWDSSYFYHGITNGAAWYAINGGMQDWDYRYQGCNEILIEVSSSHTPAPQYIPDYWEDNRESMLAYLETCLIGVRGLVTDAQTSEPLAATVVVTDRDHEIYTDPDVGDYHRMLLPGTYELMFSAAGYDSVTIPGVVVSSGDATRLDVSFWRTMVTYPNGGEVLNDGSPTTITWTGNPSSQYHVQYTANADDISTVFDGFETGSLDEAYVTGGSGTWAVTSSDSHEGLYAARSGSITHGQTTWMTRTFQGGDLSFWYRVSSESGWDFFNFYIDGDLELHASGTSGGWVPFAAVLSTGPHELKWEYTKDGSLSEGYDAAWVDEVQVSNDNTTWSDVIALTPVGATSTSWTPPGVGWNYKLRIRSFDGIDTYGSWDESDAKFAVAERVIPTVSEWGLVVMALVLCAAATLVLDRRRQMVVYARSTTAGRRADRGGRRSMNGARFVLVLVLLAWGGSVCLADDRVVDIHTAAAAGDIVSIDAMLRETPELVNARDRSGQVPLHLAAGKLHEAAAESLLDAGADVNAKDRDGLTALHIAVRAGADSESANIRRKALVSLLIRQGADIKAGESQGETPLHLVAMKDRTELLDVLLAAGADISATDRLGRTPMHYAAMYNHLAVIDWLVSKKADVEAKDNEGNTPLHVAALRFRKEAAGRLIEHGADVNSNNKQLATPLHVASAAGSDEKEVDRLLTAVADVLIKNGAGINAVDQAGHTPLHNAIERNHKALAEFLRERGAEE